MTDLHLALLQTDILWADPEANRRAVETQLPRVPAGSDLLVLPETFTTGFGPHMASLAEEAEGPTLEWARGTAARLDLLLVASWVVREGGRTYNRLHWVRPDGTYGHYDKAHLFRVSGEADQLARGTARPTFEHKGWRIRPAVCYDLRFPTWLRNRVGSGEWGVDSTRNQVLPTTHCPLPALDYDLLLVCANWPAARREAWQTLLRARAIENLCYTVGCNRVGTDPHGTPYSGDSLCADYKGLDLAHAGSGPGLTTATLGREPLDAFRRKWPFHLDFD